MDIEIDESSPEPIKPKIGIIYPPIEIRNIVDKTALFVGRNGAEFEARIRQQETGSNRFSFLNPTDPYHGYYKQKLHDIVKGEVQLTETLPSRTVQQKQNIPEKVQEQVRKVQPPSQPEELEYILDPPCIFPFELELVKLTAQFVARNGRQFLTGIMNREQRNAQFDFLRPQHSLFSYFTRLVEHYTKIILYPKDICERLQAEIDKPQRVMEALKHRIDWAAYQIREKNRIEQAVEKERVAYARIDWHDFVVVETVQLHSSSQFKLRFLVGGPWDKKTTNHSLS